MSDFLLFERDGPVVTLTMNAPERRNALSIEEKRTRPSPKPAGASPPRWMCAR
ncbi:hypothetical protein ACFQU7_28590 [Pseudoroseomonas wenyumeiae]